MTHSPATAAPAMPAPAGAAFGTIEPRDGTLFQRGSRTSFDLQPCTEATT